MLDVIKEFLNDPVRQTQLAQTGVVLIGTIILWWLFVRLVNRAVARMAVGDDIEAAERRQRTQTLWKAGRQGGRHHICR